MNLQLIKSEKFGTVTCDFYEKENEFYMTREQIGAALGYASPKKAIQKIHMGHRNRLDQFSCLIKVTPEAGVSSGGAQETIMYNRKGIMEICRWSQQPKADAFMDWTWNIMDGLITGRSAIISDKPVSANELILMMAQANIGLEKRVDKIEEKVDSALFAFTRPDKDHWKGDMEDKLSALEKVSGYCKMALRGRLYKELEATVPVNLQSRLGRMRKRYKKQGHTFIESNAISKLDVISGDAKLRPVFDGIVRKYQAAYSAKR